MTKSRERPLDDSQRRLQAVLDNASVSIFLMDDRQQCIYMNSAAEKLTGYTLADVLALDRPLHDIIHHTYPDGRPFPLHECAIDRAFPEHNQTQGEEVFVGKDGSFYPVAFTASPIRDESSQTIGTIIEVRNIAEEKRAQERQGLLVNELNHRVKNTLATIQSIAWQTFKGLSPDAVERFTGRLTVLSKAHSLLTTSAWHKAAVRDIVTAAVDPFDLERFAVEGPDCDVHPKVAVSLSMVLHELATNALKHGALSTPAGGVSIRWSCNHSPEHNELDLTWAEHGGPPVAEPTSRGFGSRLIERQLGLEFGGIAKLEFAPGGVVCRMHLNLPRNPDPIELQFTGRTGA